MNPDRELITENPFAILVRRMNRIEAQNEQILNQLLKNNPIQFPDQIGGIGLAEQITRLSKARIYTLVSERAIPHKKRGNRLYFNRTELIAWVEQGNRKERGGPEL